MIKELYESKSLGDEDDQDSQTSGGDWARVQGMNRIILTVFQVELHKSHPSLVPWVVCDPEVAMLGLREGKSSQTPTVQNGK